MTERDTTTTLRSLTPEQFLAQFADEAGRRDSGNDGGSMGDDRGSGPMEDDRQLIGTDGRLDGSDTYLLSARFAVPETATRPPLPPTPSVPGRARRLPSRLPHTVLQLPDELPADS